MWGNAFAQEYHVSLMKHRYGSFCHCSICRTLVLSAVPPVLLGSGDYRYTVSRWSTTALSRVGNEEVNGGGLEAVLINDHVALSFRIARRIDFCWGRNKKGLQRSLDRDPLKEPAKLVATHHCHRGWLWFCKELVPSCLAYLLSHSLALPAVRRSWKSLMYD